MARGTVLAEILLEGGKTFKKAIDSAGDELDDTADDAATFSGALSYAGEQLGDLRNSALGAVLSLGRVAAEADDAEDETTELALSATGASGSLAGLGLSAAGAAAPMGTLAGTTQGSSAAMTSFSVSTEGASASVATLSSTLSVGLLPVLGALATTLFPIAAVVGTAASALGGLASGLGLVVGTGAVAGWKSLNEEFKRSIGLIRAQATGFGQSFIPLLRDAIQALPTLTSNIFEAVGGLDEFADFLRDMGALAMGAIPQIAATFVDLGRQALPVVRDFIGFLSENGPSIFREMVSTTRQLAPKIMDFTDAMIEATPALLEFGTFVLSTVLPGLTKLIRTATPAIQAFASLSDETRTVQSVFNELPAGIQAVASPLKVALIPALALSKAAVNALGLDWQQNLKMMEQLTRSVFNTVTTVINNAMKQARTFIDEGWKGIVRSSIGFINVLLKKATEGVEGLTNTFIIGANALIKTMNNLIRQFNDLPGIGIGTFSTLAKVDFKAPQLSTPKSVQKRQSQRQQQPVQVEVTGKLREENGEIVGVIKNTAQNVVDQSRRQDKTRLRRNRPI